MAYGMDVADDSSSSGDNASDERWLWIEVVGARNLESYQGMDAYCVVRVDRSLQTLNGNSLVTDNADAKGRQQVWRSPTASTATDPEWRFRIDGPLDCNRLCGDAVMRIEVYNERDFFFDMFPGETKTTNVPSDRAVRHRRRSTSTDNENPLCGMGRRRRRSSSCSAVDSGREGETIGNGEALGVAELSVALLVSKLCQGVHATDAWYELRGVRSGEVRVRTLVQRHRLPDQELDEVWDSHLCEAPTKLEDDYGFRIPQHCAEEWAHLQSYEACREQRRVADWEAAFGANLLSFPSDRSSLIVKQYARSGIPRHLRPRVYMTMSGGSEKRSHSPSDYYSSLVDRIDSHDSVSFRQIELDIDRTFGHSKTKISSEAGRATMRRILKAYSLHNPAVGYCQGLNFISGFLSLVLDEESTFWVLVAICEDLYPGYYIPSMTDTQTDMLVLKQLIAEELPELDEFTTDVGLPLELLSSQWFLCLFTTTFPAETVFRVFDCLFTEGSHFVFPVVLTHLRRLQPQLLGLEDFQTVLSTMKEAENAMLDADAFILQVAREAQSITAERIEALRDQHRHTVHEGMERADRARALNRQLALVYEIPAFSSTAANLLRYFHEEAELSSRSDVAFVLTLLCHGLVWLAEHSKRLRR